MKRILVAVDGSEPSMRAARMAADVALRFGARITLAYVVPRLLLPPDVYGLTVAEVEREQRAHADTLVHQALLQLGGTGVEVETSVLSGPPAESLAEAAQGPDVDLVVVGSRGIGAVKRMLLGSVSDRLVHICPKPILIVH
ncbi:MAG TPA: universal stress protein [Anaeromyxobacteraceae bacterium]|nr:universal stress protein [Anaeromyxobacteraceae bacterium]